MRETKAIDEEDGMLNELQTKKKERKRIIVDGPREENRRS
jgi:hypothetical protein